MLLPNNEEEGDTVNIHFMRLRLQYPTVIGSNAIARILRDVLNKVDGILRERRQFTVSLHLEGMRLRDIADMQELIVSMVQVFKTQYDGKLHRCYLHHCPAFFENVLQLIRSLIGKDARSRLVIVPRSKATAAATAGTTGITTTTTALASSISVKQRNEIKIPGN